MFRYGFLVASLALPAAAAWTFEPPRVDKRGMASPLREVPPGDAVRDLGRADAGRPRVVCLEGGARVVVGAWSAIQPLGPDSFYLVAGSAEVIPWVPPVGPVRAVRVHDGLGTRLVTRREVVQTART